MAYSNANSEVKGYTGFTIDYSSTTSPTLAQVGDIIDQVDGEINTALYSLGITSTPTNASLLKMLAKYSAMGSAGLVLQRYGQSDNDYRVADWWYGKFESWMEKLTTDDKYQEMITDIASGSTGGDDYYVASNVTDGTHEGATPESTTISYGVDGFEV